MSFRRNREQLKEEKRWQSFCVTNQGLIQQSGLAPGLYETEEEFAVFLEHGHAHPDDSMPFSVTGLTSCRYQALYQFIDKYFEAGYHASQSSLVALHKKDVQKLAQKYPSQLT